MDQSYKWWNHDCTQFQGVIIINSYILLQQMYSLRQRTVSESATSKTGTRGFELPVPVLSRDHEG
jgi:hypothetical protein